MIQMNAQDPLSQLRDLQPPNPLWALMNTPLFWVLLIASLVLLYFLYKKIKTHIQKNSYRKAALAELQKIQNETDTATQLARLNRLLKQTAIVGYPIETVASLSGKTWLAFLDKSADTTEFSSGPGRLLLTGPYQSSLEASSLSALFSISEQWIKEHQRC